MDKKAFKEVKSAIRTLAAHVKQLRLVCDALRTSVNTDADEQFRAAARTQLHLLLTSMRERLDVIENVAAAVSADVDAAS